MASVYLNRLDPHMLLGADPTVIYTRCQPLGRQHHKADLQIASPYNTYRFPGLPPGPTQTPAWPRCRRPPPPRDSLPYFVARHDGDRTRFATNIEGLRNVRQFRSSGNASEAAPASDCTEVRAAGVVS